MASEDKVHPQPHTFSIRPLLGAVSGTPGGYAGEDEYSTRLGGCYGQVVRDVDAPVGFRILDKPTSES